MRKRGWAVLLAAAILLLAACAASTEESDRYNIDLKDMDALSREYLAPIAAMGDSYYWNDCERLNAVQLLQYAAYELYGYKGTDNLELAAAYGDADAVKCDELEELHRDDGFYHLPKAEVYAAIQKHFDLTEEQLDTRLGKRFADERTALIVSAAEMSERTIAYADNAEIEDDTLRIQYSMVNAQPGDEGFLAQHMADYTETHETIGTYVIAIRLEEDGGWKYIVRDNYHQKVTLPRPEGEPEPLDLLQNRKVQQELQSEEISDEGWTLLGSRAVYSPLGESCYLRVEGTVETCIADGWKQKQVSVYRTAEGYTTVYWEKCPDRISGKENPTVTKWIEFALIADIEEETAPFDFGDMVISIDPVSSSYTLYSPGTDCSIMMDAGKNWCTTVVEHSGSEPRYVTFRSELAGENSRYAIVEYDRTEGEERLIDCSIYDRENHRLTTILENQNSWQSGGIGGSDRLIQLVAGNGATTMIYDAAQPESPLMTFDKTNLQLDGCDAVHMEWIYADDRGGNTLALVYYPYDSSDVPANETYQMSPYYWKVLTMTAENDEPKPQRTLTLPQHVFRSRGGNRDLGEVIVRDGLMYYSNYYDENGSQYLSDGTQLWERWCLNLTTGQSQRISTNDPDAVSYADEKFIAKAKAMGYTDEMLEVMETARVAAADVLSGEGAGGGSEDFYSPGVKYRAYSRGLNKEYDKTMVVLLDSDGNMRVVPQVWNNGYGTHGSNCAFTKLGFTAEGLLWISDDRGVFYYDPESIMAVAEDRSPVYSWSPREMETGDDIPYVMLVRGYRAEKRIAVLWSTLPADWDGWSKLPADTTIHAAVLDSTGQLLNDWDTKINPGCYEEGGPVRLYSNVQKDGYLCFYVDGKHRDGSADYELNLTTGEVNRVY